MSVYGKVELDPEGEVVAGSMCSWRITYTVGMHGIDDGGSIVLLRKSICDMEEPQFEDPKASGYVTATTTGDAELASEKLGEEMKVNGQVYSAFALAQALARASVDEMRECKLSR